MGKAYNAFLKLPVIHHADNADFVHAIHQAQNIVLARVGLRAINIYRLEPPIDNQDPNPVPKTIYDLAMHPEVLEEYEVWWKGLQVTGISSFRGIGRGSFCINVGNGLKRFPGDNDAIFVGHKELAQIPSANILPRQPKANDIVWQQVPGLGDARRPVRLRWYKADAPIPGWTAVTMGKIGGGRVTFLTTEEAANSPLVRKEELE